MKNKILALIIGIGVIGGSSYVALASSTADNSNAINSKSKACCTQKAQCCIQKLPCCK